MFCERSQAKQNLNLCFGLYLCIMMCVFMHICVCVCACVTPKICFVVISSQVCDQRIISFHITLLCFPPRPHFQVSMRKIKYTYWNLKSCVCILHLSLSFSIHMRELLAIVSCGHSSCLCASWCVCACVCLYVCVCVCVCVYVCTI